MPVWQGPQGPAQQLAQVIRETKPGPEDEGIMNRARFQPRQVWSFRGVYDALLNRRVNQLLRFSGIGRCTGVGCCGATGLRFSGCSFVGTGGPDE